MGTGHKISDMPPLRRSPRSVAAEDSEACAGATGGRQAGSASTTCSVAKLAMYTASLWLPCAAAGPLLPGPGCSPGGTVMGSSTTLLGRHGT